MGGLALHFWVLILRCYALKGQASGMLANAPPAAVTATAAFFGAGGPRHGAGRRVRVLKSSRRQVMPPEDMASQGETRKHLQAG